MPFLTISWPVDPRRVSPRDNKRKRSKGATGLTVDSRSNTRDKASVDVIGRDHALELLNLLLRERLQEIFARILGARLAIGSDVGRA